MAELADLVLEAIAKSSSQHPARADHVRDGLAVTDAEFEPAVEALARDCRINTAQITRGGVTWLAIWPTGIYRPNGGWSGRSHGALFLRDAPIVPALRAASAPRVRESKQTPRAEARTAKQEETPMRTHKRGELREVALEALRTAGKPLTVAEIAAAISSSVENTRQLIYRLVEKGLVEDVGPRNGGTAHCFRSTSVSAPDETPDAQPQSVQAVAKPAPDKASATEVTGRVAARLQFALWDDGRLSILDADQVIQILPDDTARLARLLGVPGNNTYPPSGD